MDEKVDVFSFACIVNECLTRRPPWEDLNFFQVLLTHSLPNSLINIGRFCSGYAKCLHTLGSMLCSWPHCLHTLYNMLCSWSNCLHTLYSMLCSWPHRLHLALDSSCMQFQQLPVPKLPPFFRWLLLLRVKGVKVLLNASDISGQSYS